MTKNLPDNNADCDLRERFAALRREDAAQTPAFTSLVRRAPRKRKPVWPRFAAAATALGVPLLLVALLLVRFYPRHHPPAEVSIMEWKSPTDFLLETPGHDLLRTVPSFGPWTAEPAQPAESPTPAGKKKS
jgi:hypothetical protein